jgi:hypothetical protein
MRMVTAVLSMLLLKQAQTFAILNPKIIASSSGVRRAAFSTTAAAAVGGGGSREKIFVVDEDAYEKHVKEAAEGDVEKGTIDDIICRATSESIASAWSMLNSCHLSIATYSSLINCSLFPSFLVITCEQNPG